MTAVNAGAGEAEASARRLKIAVCPPVLDPLQRALRGETTNATYIVQRYVIGSLKALGHDLTFLVERQHPMNVFGPDPHDPADAPRSWSASRPFVLLNRSVWTMQRRLGIPYLGVFAHLQLLDAALHCLPGHDIVYERSALYRAGIASAAKRLRLPYVLFVEADEILEHEYTGDPLRGLQRWRAGRMFRHNLRAADRVICVSEPLRRHLALRWGVPAGRMVVVPNGVDVARFAPDVQRRDDLRRTLRLGDRPLIVFVGGFYRWHDVGSLLDAFALVRAQRPDVRLILVGDGAERPAMERHAARVGVAGACTFTGLVSHDDIPGFMSAADVGVATYPRLDDDLWLSPLKLYEYLASGLAVVASAVGQITEVIRDGHNGLLVAPGDVGALGRALVRLIDDAALRARLGGQARADAVGRHSWEQYGLRLQRLFLELAPAGPPRR